MTKTNEVVLTYGTMSMDSDGNMRSTPLREIKVDMLEYLHDLAELLKEQDNNNWLPVDHKVLEAYGVKTTH